MKRLRIILGYGLLMIASACTSEVDEIPPIHIHATNQPVAEGDTLELSITRGNETVTAVNWNRNDIQLNTSRFRWIVPTIQTDTTSFNLIATAGEQTDVKTIVVYKRALKQPEVSYANFIVPLLEQNCNFSGCHGQGSRAGKVNLSVYDSTAKFAIPYSASQSLLYTSILKEDPLRRMPPAGKLHDDKIEKIRLWIEQGARNN